ncbi:hypothetical protein Baya_7331 [Bagarius yarrelli]|uniref:Uncharacterized protein n=1 Tax=Bagarius yarrelli TaxID=175774 RepID=A0A556U1Q7_BAGYA|nr:hypothetical protein Baya_7331 [Bagarius yarrelli]
MGRPKNLFFALLPTNFTAKILWLQCYRQEWEKTVPYVTQVKLKCVKSAVMERQAVVLYGEDADKEPVDTNAEAKEEKEEGGRVLEREEWGIQLSRS